MDVCGCIARVWVEMVGERDRQTDREREKERELSMGEHLVRGNREQWKDVLYRVIDKK